MRIDRQKEKDDKKKKRESEFEKMIFQIMEKSMKSALDAAIDEINQYKIIRNIQKEWN